MVGDIRLDGQDERTRVKNKEADKKREGRRGGRGVRRWRADAKHTHFALLSATQHLSRLVINIPL